MTKAGFYVIETGFGRRFYANLGQPRTSSEGDRRYEDDRWRFAFRCQVWAREGAVRGRFAAGSEGGGQRFAWRRRWLRSSASGWARRVAGGGADWRAEGRWYGTGVWEGLDVIPRHGVEVAIRFEAGGDGWQRQETMRARVFMRSIS